MDQSKINVRYAKALYSLAKEKGQLSSIKKDIELIDSLCRNEPEMKLLLESPIIKTVQKTRIATTLFQGRIQPLTLQFIQTVIRNKREAFLTGICRNILTSYRKEEGIEQATITSAIPLQNSMTDKMKVLLEEEIGVKIELNTQVDPQLIGGFILRVGDRQLDASISTQLMKIKDKLLHSEVN